MKNKIIVSISLLLLLVSYDAFAQNTRVNDPFFGIWFVENDGTKFLQVYIDGIIIQLADESSITEIYNYTISGNRLIIEDGKQEFIFIVLNQNIIILECDGEAMLLKNKVDPI